ncbi:hypothetical protein AB0M22_45065 [Nocardia sp. NPDC051756]|uniref:hypothetical protein n=1 Tax=Nocardia sp. NPDC051756 TaxID=3154751 RepID=UPI00342ECAAF
MMKKYRVIVEHTPTRDQRTFVVDADVQDSPGGAADYVNAVLAPLWFVREVLPA